MLIIAFVRSDGSLTSRLFGSSRSKPESCSPVVLSFFHFICSMFEQVNSNWHGIPPHSCLQMSSATDQFISDFATTCKKIPRYLGELTWQMAGRLIAQHYFHDVLVNRVVKRSFSNNFFSDRWLPHVLINMISTGTHSWCDSEHFHVAWLPSYRFALFSCTLFSNEFHCFHFNCGF